MRKGSKLASNDVPQFSLLFQRFRFLSHQTERQVEKRKEGGSEETKKRSQNKEELPPCPPFRGLV